MIQEGLTKEVAFKLKPTRWKGDSWEELVKKEQHVQNLQYVQEIEKALVAVKRVYEKGERGKQAPDCKIL